MKAGKTEKLIAQAIAALPYRRPRAGFAARVMAQVAAAPAPVWYAPLLEPVGLLLAAWGAVICFTLGRLVLANSAYIAATLIQPGGFTHALSLATARAVLAADKLACAVSYAAGLLPPLSRCLPGWQETALATVSCSLIIAALARHGSIPAVAAAKKTE
jgi:hypothetical protein